MESTRIAVYEWGPANFKKNGQLKKNAKFAYSRTIIGHDADEYKPEKEAQEVVDYFSKWIAPIVQINSPYVFTHIVIHADNRKSYMLFQDVMIKGGWLMTSPTALFAEMQKRVTVKVGVS
jgi:hypothetical protein